MRIAAFIFFLLHCSAVFAGGIVPVIVVSTDSPRAGQPLTFFVYWHNSDDQPAQIDPPYRFVCQIASMDKTVEVMAQAVQTPDATANRIEPNGFKKLPYWLKIPSSCRGAVALTIPAMGTAAVMFAVDTAPQLSEKDEVTASGKTATPDYDSLDSLFALYQPYLGNITAYKPMYFLVGADPQYSKFQISFKYRFLNPVGSLSKQHPWVNGFHLAYTQTSFWDLKSASAPFEDTSYKPEVFFQSPNIKTGLVGIKRLFLQTGFQHESNGRGAESSRSTNFLYVKPIFVVFNEKNRFGLQVAPRIWTYVANDEGTNPDIADYRGYFDLELKFGKADSVVLGTLLRWADKGGSIEIDLTFPLHQFSNNVQIYLQAQYVSDLAESLLHYQERTEALRFGFAIVR
ncbi:MAG: phospholipase A [Thermodesulfobacteriota bacterium]